MARQFVGVRLPTDLLEKAKIAAESEHRTISNYILSLIAEDIARRGTGKLAETTQSPDLPAQIRAAVHGTKYVPAPRGTKERSKMSLTQQRKRERKSA